MRREDLNYREAVLSITRVQVAAGKIPEIYVLPHHVDTFGVLEGAGVYRVPRDPKLCCSSRHWVKVSDDYNRKTRELRNRSMQKLIDRLRSLNGGNDFEGYDPSKSFGEGDGEGGVM